MSFFDGFDQVVKNSIKVEVGRNKPFIVDKTKINRKNYKGKQVAYYKRAETLEEMEKHGIGSYMEYLPAEEVSLPINISVTSSEKLRLEIEKTSQFTNKKSTDHIVRLYDDNDNQVGFADIDVTPSGDIYHEYKNYTTHDLTKGLTHAVHRKLSNGKIVIDEELTFERFYETGAKSINVYQHEGKVVGGCVEEKEYENKEGLKFPELAKSVDYINQKKLKSHISSCVSDETDIKKRESAHVPWECFILERDLLSYQYAMNDFQTTSEMLKEKSGIDFTIEKAIKLGEETDYRPYEIGVPVWFNYWRYYQLAKFLADENNNRFKDFKGTYVGNILKLRDGEGFEACIVSKHSRDNQNYRLYTLIDFRGTSITKGTSPLYPEEERDKKCLERLAKADKTPTFVTKIDKDGKEELVLYRGNAVSGECKEYEQFKEDFLNPFAGIKPFKIDKILKQKRENDREEN